MLTEQELKKFKNFVNEIKEEKIHNSQDGNLITLHDLALRRQKEIDSIDKESISPLIPVIYTTASIQTKVPVAIKMREYFFEKFPQIDSLKKLKKILDNTSAEDFLKTYLNINSKVKDASKTQRYIRLKNLCEGFLEYKDIYKFSSEKEAIKDWALKVNLDDLENDMLGRRKWIKTATVQNVLLTLNLDTIKGDVNVLTLMNELFLRKFKANELGKIADQINVREIYLDTLLFQYGRMKYQNSKSAQS